jgi:hypothetical protein
MMKVLAIVAVVAATLAGSTPAGDARSPAGTGVVEAEVLRVVAVPKADGRRAVIVELRTDERITAVVRVIRYQTVAARSRLVPLRRGRWIFSVRLPRDLAAGRAGVAVRLTDRRGNVETFRRPIRVPRSV